MPKVSIIVPIYNVEKYLDKCIDSLVHQTLTDIEIICIDDCSTDDSYNILQKWGNLDSRIKIIRNKKNSGLATSRNNGLKVAKSAYIMFCDSDDWFEPQMCECMLDLITKNHADLGICSVNVVYEADATLKNNDKKFILPDGCFNIHDEQINHFQNGAPLRIFKHNILTKNDIKFPDGFKYEDMYFSNVYNLHIKKIATTSEKLYNYRRRSDSIMNNTYSGKINVSLDYLGILANYLKYLQKHKLYEREYTNFWTKFFINCVRGALMFTKNKQHMKILDKMLTDFISKNYIFGTTDLHTDYIMSLILDGVFMRKKKYLGGLIQVYHDGTKTEYNLWKICIFKTKHLETETKYYLFGISVYKKVKK